MTSQEQQLNTFLVQVFNDILRLEEISLRGGDCSDLSVSELHVLEAVGLVSAACDGQAGMTDVAAQLCVTAGTLSVAVKTLEHKGYLVRTRSPRDKRRVSLALTPAAQPALRRHAAFHEELVTRAAGKLSAEQISALTSALSELHGFFRSLA